MQSEFPNFDTEKCPFLTQSQNADIQDLCIFCVTSLVLSDVNIREGNVIIK